MHESIGLGMESLTDSDGYSSAENSSAESCPISGTNVGLKSVRGRPRKAATRSRGRPRKHQKTDTTVGEKKTIMSDAEECQVSTSSNIN